MGGEREGYVENTFARLLVEVGAEIFAHGKLHEDDVEQVAVALGGVVERGDRVDDMRWDLAERIAFLLQLRGRNRLTVQGVLDDENDIIDHEFVSRLE